MGWNTDNAANYNSFTEVFDADLTAEKLLPDDLRVWSIHDDSSSERLSEDYALRGPPPME